MAKKDKIVIQRDKTMEPIDNELDEAMGLLETANRQITDLLASLEAAPAPEAAVGAAELEDGETEPAKPTAEGTRSRSEDDSPSTE